MNALSLKALITKTSLKKTAIYSAVKAGTFPPPAKLGGGSRSAWLESEVDDWLAKQFAGRSIPKPSAKNGR